MVKVRYTVGFAYAASVVPGSEVYSVLFESKGISNVTPEGIVYVPAGSVALFANTTV